MIYNLPEGEKTVMMAFFSQEMDERAEKNTAIQEAAKNGFYCPNM